MHRLEISLLGSPRIILDDQRVETDRHKAIGLLAYLVVEARAHNREALAALLWPDYPRASAFSYLRRTLWELNQMLGKGWITADREQVVLERIPGLEVDVEAFQHCLADPAAPIRVMTEAVALYRGDFLEGLVIADTAPFEEWQIQQVEHFRRQFAQMLEKLIEAHEQKGDYALALPYAQRWQALDRLDEAACRAVMRQLAGMGDRSGVVRAYQACLQVLEDALGIQPQAETQALYDTILHGDTPQSLATPEQEPTPAGIPSSSGSLPTPATPFIGRAIEIEQIVELVSEPGTRLLTLTGPGGTGKTRLSIQAAKEVVDPFPDGVWFVPLATVQSLPGLILAIAKGLSFSFFNDEKSSPRQQLLDYLRQKHLLLVLDNFEQLVEPGRELVLEILEAAPAVKLLVSSRERLNLQTERIFKVSGMRTPDPHTVIDWDDPEAQAKPYSAIQLLVERARRVRPNFRLSQENLLAVAQICRLVEGSPLGIELATAWLELLSPAEIAAEITRSLDFLESEAADIPLRQRSLRVVFDTSWELLAAEERQALRRLCVFPGSFSHQAAQQVSGCTVRTLLRLANKSWLQPVENGRYVLHEVLRQYGLERLRADPREWHETNDRQAEFFANFVKIQGDALRTAGQIQALQALTIEMESNIPRAWEWLVSNGQIDALIEKMLLGLFNYWLILIRADEFLPRLKQARQAVQPCEEQGDLLRWAILETAAISLETSSQVYDDQPKERLERLWVKVKESGLEDEMGFWYIVLVISYGQSLNFELGYKRLAQIMPKIRALQDPWILGYSYMYSSLAIPIGQHAIAQKYLQDALAIFKQIGVVFEQGVALLTLGRLAASALDYKQAIQYTQAAQRFFEQVSAAHSIMVVFPNLAEYHIFLGNVEQAFLAYQELRRFAEKAGNRRLLGETLASQSRAVARYGDLEEALEIGKTSRELAIEVSNQNDIAWHTWELGDVYRLMGDMVQAREYYQQALPYFENMQDFVGLGFYQRGLGDIALMQGHWDEARQRYQQALAVQEKELRSLRTWGLAFYHARLGFVLVQLGAINEAKQHLQTALMLAEQWVYPDMKALPLTGIASLLAATGFTEQAIEVAACVVNQPTTWNEVKEQARAILEMAEGTVSVDEAEKAQQRGEEWQIDALCRHYLDNPLLEG